MSANKVTLRTRRLLIGIGLSAMLLCSNGGSLFADELQIEAAPISFPNPSMSPKCVIEFSYLVNQSGLDFLTDSATGIEIGGIFAQIVIFDSASVPIDSVAQSFNVRKSDGFEGTARVAGRLRIPLDAGRYSAVLTVLDIVSKREATSYFRLPISAPPTDRLSISGIEIAHSLETLTGEGDNQDPLAKNGRRVAPNPSGVISADSDSVRMYVEIYNLQPDSMGEYRVGLRVELSEPGLEYPFIVDERFITAPGPSIVYAKALENRIHYSANASLRFIVTDANSQVTDTSVRLFRIIGDEPFATRADNQSDESLLPYDTTSHKTKMNLVYWILSPHQRELIESLTLAGQGQFIKRFWQDNDTDPTTLKNEFRDDAYERFVYANDHYSNSIEAADGWKRDPGRILIQYGMPSERIEVASPTISNDITKYNPWERWNYDFIQGGVYFIFSLERGYGEYILRHSNAQGENFDRGIEENINKLFRSSGG